MLLLKVEFPETINVESQVYSLENVKFKELRIEDGKLKIDIKKSRWNEIMSNINQVGSGTINIKLIDNGKVINKLAFYNKVK